MSQKDKAIKTIRVTNQTYEKLASYGKYSDSMEKIVCSIIEKMEALKNA